MQKSIFLALTSAALLFSCAKNELDIVAPVENSADLSITIQGTAQMSPVPSKAASADESKMTQAMAFVFRGSEDNAILDCTPFALNTDQATTTAKVTSEAQWVFIVANKGVNVAGIKTLGDLKAVTASLYQNDELTQKQGELIMWGSNSIDKANAVYVSNLTLRFAPAKITFKYTVSGANASDLTAQALTVLNAQSTSRLLPANTVVSSKNDYVSLLPSAEKLTYGAGISMAGFAVKPASYDIVAPLNNTVSGETIYTYYLFENDETFPTIFALSGEFAGKTLYYPIAFSNTDNSATTNEFEPIKAGRHYNITVNVKNVLAGSTDPTQPTTSQDIEVTVVPADWDTVIEWVKDFE